MTIINIIQAMQGGKKMSKELYKRIFVIVCDSMGIGNAEDAALFGDEGANTIVKQKTV